MAADFYSAILGWLNQGTGNNNNSWGDNCDNSIFPIFEKAIAGRASHAVTGGTLDLSTDAPPSGPTAALEMMQAFSGTLSSDQTVVVPNLTKMWLVSNATTGAFALKFKTTSGTAVTIPQGGSALVWCDGADGVFVGLSTSARDVQWLGPDGTEAAPGLSFTAEANSGLRRVSDKVVALTINGSDVVTFSENGVDVTDNLILSVGGTAIVPPGTEVETAAIRVPTGWYFEYGQAVARSTDQPLMNAITEAFTADTNATTTLSNVSKDLRNLGLEGAPLEGTGIPTGTTIVSISATTIVMSAAATTTATGVALRAFPYGNGNGVDTFNIPDARGTVAAGRDNMGGTTAGRLTLAGSGVNGLQLKTIGGVQTVTIAQDNLPDVNFTVTTPAGQGTHSHGLTNQPLVFGGPTLSIGSSGGASFSSVNTTASALPAMSGTAASGGSGTALTNVQPTRIRNVMIKR